jgi:hypothetical protein
LGGEDDPLQVSLDPFVALVETADDMTVTLDQGDVVGTHETVLLRIAMQRGNFYRQPRVTSIAIEKAIGIRPQQEVRGGRKRRGQSRK